MASKRERSGKSPPMNENSPATSAKASNTLRSVFLSRAAARASAANMAPAMQELDKAERKAHKSIGKPFTFVWYNTPERAQVSGTFADADAVKAAFAKARDELRTVTPAPTGDAAHVLRGLELAVKALDQPQPQPAPITVNLTAQMPALGEPAVIINVPSQPAPQVTVNVPEQAAPQVNVTNEVNPAAVTVNNEVKANDAEMKIIADALRLLAEKPTADRIKVQRNADGLITGAEII